MQYSLYVHIPFCTHRCAYCDFNTYAGQGDLIPAYVLALCREIGWIGERAPADALLHTVYFGGGTPSLLSSHQFEAILSTIHAAFQVAHDAEITMEANPGTVLLPELRNLRGLGINRISLGVQSANGEELRMLERIHSFLEVLEAVSAARRAGFDNLSVDLIYGLPGQDQQTWKTTVQRVLDLNPDHLSAYALTLEHGTPFERWTARGQMPAPDPDAAADMYEWFSDEVMRAGYAQYEISNWAQDGRACRHNLQYWRGLPYLGVGAGAHGYADGFRYSNVLGIRAYLARINAALGDGPDGEDPRRLNSFPLSPAAVEQHLQQPVDDQSEFMIMGLRLTEEGISADGFQRRFGVSLQERFGAEIQRLEGFGLLESARLAEKGQEADSTGSSRRIETIRLTRRGRLLGNRVFGMFV